MLILSNVAVPGVRSSGAPAFLTPTPVSTPLSVSVNSTKKRSLVLHIFSEFVSDPLKPVARWQYFARDAELRCPWRHTK